ncbi:MAG: AI-2E family transporter [Methanosarcinales archaeon]|nr:AI-2E family transporter [Methanosarcinales archaeon]
MNNKKILDISWGTILKILTIVFVLYVLYFVRDIIIWVVFALVISILFNSLIDFLHKRKIPRIIAVILVYFSAFGLMGFAVYACINLFMAEFRQFIQLFPQYLEQFYFLLGRAGIENFVITPDFLDNIMGQDLTAESLLQALFAFFGGIGITFFVFLLAIFFSLEKETIEKFFILFFSKKQEAFVLNLWKRVYKKVNAWFGTRVIASLFVGLMVYVSFLLLDISYPFAFAILATVLNFIPYIGPLITGAIMFLVTATISIPKAIFVVVLFTLIQQVESSVLSPLLTKKIVGIPACLALIAFLIGFRFGGILGAILIIPLAGILFEFLKNYLKKRKQDEAIML